MHERNHILDVLTNVPLDEFLKATAIQSRGNYQPGTVLDVLRQPAVIEKPREIAEATNSRKLRRVHHLLRQGLTARAISIAFGMPEDEVEEQQMQVAQAASRTRSHVVRNS